MEKQFEERKWEEGMVVLGGEASRGSLWMEVGGAGLVEEEEVERDEIKR